MSKSDDRIESIFAAVVALPVDQRGNYLDAECANSPPLRQQIDALLRAHDRANHFLDRSASDLKQTAEHVSQVQNPGEVIAGKYTLVEIVGQGGMGSVWRAKQTEPVKRFVAVKLIKAGMDSKQVLARFDAERQALALMDHPNIAKVLDGGLHQHWPYFVMELVKGVPITEYCDKCKLAPRERLELFVPVCQAIQHAHQKGIIHRDIKPSNVLVAVYDDKPVVKVIDFGVAKATGGELTEATIDTGFGAVVGTPQYMSPEQATFNNIDIDTRTDVYALGVLLYELLTGSTPFSQKELEKRGLLEMLRVVREEEPPRPSTKLSSAEALPTLSANRGTEPKKLTGLLKNELDWIVMKALEKDRARRYETANGFAADVQRYLSGDAVQAHPPSKAYRLKKFLRRNKGQVVAAGLVFAALLIGMVGTTLGLFEARRQAGIAQKEAKAKEQARAAEAKQRQAAEANAERARKSRDRVADVLDAMTSREVESVLGAQKALTADQRKFLETVLTYYREYADEAGGDLSARRRAADAATRVGDIYFHLGQLSESCAAHAKGVKAARALVREDPSNDNRFRLAFALLKSANVENGAGRSEGALVLLDEAIPVFSDLVLPIPPATGMLMLAVTVRAFALRSLGRINDDRQMLANLLQKFEHLSSNEAFARSISVLRDELAESLAQHGDWTGAEAEYRKSLASLLTTPTPEDPAKFQSVIAGTRSKLAKVLVRRGERKEAEALYRAAADTERQIVAENPAVEMYSFKLTETLTALSDVIGLERLSEAEALRAEARAVRKKMVDELANVPSGQVTRAGLLCNMGNDLVRGGKVEESLPSFGKAIEILSPLHRDEPQNLTTREFLKNCHSSRADAYRILKRYAESAEDWAEVSKLAKEEDQAWAHYQRGLALDLAGDDQGATRELDLAYELRKKVVDSDPAERDPHWFLGLYFNDRGKYEQEHQRYQAALDWFNKAVPEWTEYDRKWPHPVVIEQFRLAHEQRAVTLVLLGRHAESLPDYDKALELCPVADRPQIRTCRALALAHTGRAEQAMAEAVDLDKTTTSSADFFYDLACLYAVVSGRLPGKKIECADSAMKALQNAVKAGFKDSAHMKQDTDLDPLREREDFKNLTAELEKQPSSP